MAVVWQSFVDWDPRVGPDGDDRFTHPATPFTKAALEQIIEEINDDLADEDKIDFSGDQTTKELMNEMKEKVQDRLIPGFFPFFRSEFPVGTILEEYAWGIHPGTEKLINASDVFATRQLSGGNYIPFQNQSYTVIARQTIGPVTTFDFKQFGFLTVQESNEADFTLFGYTDTVGDFLAANTSDVLHGVTAEVEVGVWVNVYQDFIGDYWRRQYVDSVTGDYIVTFDETDDDWTFTFVPDGVSDEEVIQIQLYWYGPIAVNRELPGQIILSGPLDVQQIVIPKGTVAGLRTTGFVGNSRIENFKLSSELPILTNLELEGGTIRLGQEGYAVPGEDLIETDSPHKIVLTFDRDVVDPITLYVSIQGFPVHSRGVPAVRARKLHQRYPGEASLTLTPADGDVANLNNRLGVEFAGNVIRLPFIPGNWTATGWTIDDVAIGGIPVFRLGPDHETPALISVGAISGCIGGLILGTTATDGDVVDDDFVWGNNP